MSENQDINTTNDNIKADGLKSPAASHDNAWKEIINEKYLSPFLEFYFPEFHQDIDFSKGVKFLNTELPQLEPDDQIGDKRADVLVEVYLKDGTVEWYLIHIEVQSYVDKNFSRRLYLYNSRIFNKYAKPVITLALITEDSEWFRPAEYKVAHRSFELSFKFPVIKIIDYKDRTAELEKSMNPFAIATFAYLRLIESKDDIEKKYRWKKSLIGDLYQKGFAREDIIALFRFIDWIIRMPADMEQNFREEIRKIKTEGGITVDETLHTIESLTRQREREEMAAKMLDKGMDIKTIMEVTGLSEDDVKRVAGRAKAA